MTSFEATPRRWGNSLGITLPKELVEQQGIAAGKPVTVFVIRQDTSDLRRIFGSVKLKRSTDDLLKEADEGWPSDW